MKKFCIIFLLSIIISLTAVGFSPAFKGLSSEPTARTEYLRIHIRAHSNDQADQAVKYAVRDELVAYLTPIVAECKTRDQAAETLRARLTELEERAKKALTEKGFLYGAAADVKTERFPTRIYGEYTLEEGEYLALIVYLGDGAGANWWCVVYPPLCFVGEAQNTVYKSKIVEIIADWKARYGK